MMMSFVLYALNNTFFCNLIPQEMEGNSSEPTGMDEGEEGSTDLYYVDDDADDDDAEEELDDAAAKDTNATAGDVTDAIDLRTSTLKDMSPAWFRTVYHHVKGRPQYVLDGWAKAGLADAWNSNVISQAHRMHAAGTLWPPTEERQKADDGEDPLSRQDEIDDEEKNAAREGEGLILNADGSVNTRTGISYPVTTTAPGHILDNLPNSIYHVTPAMSITSKKAATSKPPKRGPRPLTIGGDSSPLPHPLVGLHWFEGEGEAYDEGIEMRLLYVGEEEGKPAAWAFVQCDPTSKKRQISLPESFKTKEKRMNWYKKHCKKYDLNEVYDLLLKTGYDPEAGGKSPEEVKEYVKKISGRSEEVQIVPEGAGGASMETDDGGEGKEKGQEEEKEAAAAGEEKDNQEEEASGEGDEQEEDDSARYSSRSGRVIKARTKVIIGSHNQTININNNFIINENGKGKRK
jgi:hypothetical protein